MLTLTSEEIKKFLEAAATENNMDWKDPYTDNKEMVAFVVGLIYVELIARKNGWNKTRSSYGESDLLMGKSIPLNGNGIDCAL